MGYLKFVLKFELKFDLSEYDLRPFETNLTEKLKAFEISQKGS